jgi:hypothetical protein
MSISADVSSVSRLVVSLIGFSLALSVRSMGQSRKPETRAVAGQ